MDASYRGQETIPIAVSAEAAAFFRSLPEARPRLIEVLIDRTIEAAMSGNEDDLRTLMKKASKRAKRRGLTPEVLQQILDEEKLAGHI